MTAALQTFGLVRRFGGIAATNNVGLTIEAGARHALIGPNGAGKTTLINLLTGVVRPTAGRILLNGEDITRLPPHQRISVCRSVTGRTTRTVSGTRSEFPPCSPARGGPWTPASKRSARTARRRSVSRSMPGA